MDLDTVKTWGLVLAVGLPLVGILLALVVKAVVMKVVLLTVFVLLGLVVWAERGKVMDYACGEEVSFFGMTVSVPQGVQDQLCHD